MNNRVKHSTHLKQQQATEMKGSKFFSFLRLLSLAFSAVDCVLFSRRFNIAQLDADTPSEMNWNGAERGSFFPLGVVQVSMLFSGARRLLYAFDRNFLLLSHSRTNTENEKRAGEWKSEKNKKSEMEKTMKTAILKLIEYFQHSAFNTICIVIF